MTETKNAISPEQHHILQQEAPAAEQLGTLTSTQLEVINDAGWFKMFLPESMGGMGLTLPEGLRLEEALAKIDGSLGWTITLCSGATMFAGYMHPDVTKELIADPKACFGGSGAPHGVAEITDDEYVINGMWKYATGTPHLTAFTANCQIVKDGTIQRGDNGQPLVRAFVLLPDEVQVEEDWDAMGLIATAGHSFAVNDLYVSNDRVFDILPEAAHVNDPIFRYPFIPFAETTLAVNTLGMAQHFLECCEKIFITKYGQHNRSMDLLQDGRKNLTQLRDAFYLAADRSWNELLSAGVCSEDTLIEINTVSVNLVQGAREIAVRLFPYCGMSATSPDSDVNRVWRDMFTASQHSLLNRQLG